MTLYRDIDKEACLRVCHHAAYKTDKHTRCTILRPTRAPKYYRIELEPTWNRGTWYDTEVKCTSLVQARKVAASRQASPNVVRVRIVNTRDGSISFPA